MVITKEVQTITNCYAYAINNQVKDYEDGSYIDDFLQRPGAYGGVFLNSIHYYAPADVFINAVEKDFEAYNEKYGTNLIFRRITNKYEACSPGTYKVALVMSPGQDYHWYRQDADGFWSHKPGLGGEITRSHASTELISDPSLLEDQYYSQFIGFFEVTPWDNTRATE